MPYVKKDQRVYNSTEIERIPLDTAGNLNYIFTELSLRYLKQNGICYQTYNDIVGALEGCKLEMYRREISPYEDEKIMQNGDVY